MKRTALLVVLSLVTLGLSFPGTSDAQQPGWNWQNPVPTGNDLYDITYWNTPGYEDRAYVSGSHGTVLRTHTAKDFSIVETPTTVPLRGIRYREGLYALGYNGTIIFSSDEGESWTVQQSGSTDYLRDADFTTAGTGWIVGHNRAILHTEDGGSSWESQSLPGTTHLEAVDFINDSEGWAVGYGGKAAILHTTDGGNFWMGQSNPAIHRLHDISMSASGSGWAVGERWTMVSTDDFGATWSREDSLTDADYYTVEYRWNSISGGKIWVGGTNGTILHSADGGDTWSFQHSNTGLPIHKIVFHSETDGWAVGPAGLILHTTDGGSSWSKVSHSKTAAAMRAVHFANPDTGWVAGENGVIMRTDDGGETWRHQALVSSYTYNDIHIVGVDTGWVAGNDGVVLHTISGGEGSLGMWPTVSTPTGTDADLYAIHFPNRMDGWAVGRYGTIIYTPSFGETWYAQESGTQNYLYGVFFASRTWGWAVGLSGTVLVTYNGGETWAEMSSGTTNRLTSVFAVDSLNVWATGARGTLIHSTNGGKTWELQNTGTFQTLNRVHFVDHNFGWAVGELGTIIWTDDGGETWQQQTSGTDNRLSGVFFTDVNNGWAVGANGTILATSNGGVTAPAFVQFVHGAADIALAIVDIYVNGQRVIDDLAYRDASAKLTVPIDAVIGIAEGSTSQLDPGDPTFTVTFTPGETFAAVLAGEVGHADGPLSLVTFPKKKPGKTLEPVSAGIVHAIVDGPAVDCYVNSGSEATVLAFGEASMASSTSDQQIIHIRRHDDGSLIESFDVTLGAGSEAFPIILTGYMSPPPGSEDRTMSMMVVSENGEVSAPAIVTSTEGHAGVTAFRLDGSYPNPFNASTRVVFDLPHPADVTVTVYDVLGRVVRKVEQQGVAPGARRSLNLSGAGLPSGLYLYQLRAETAGATYSASGGTLLVH